MNQCENARHGSSGPFNQCCGIDARALAFTLACHSASLSGGRVVVQVVVQVVAQVAAQPLSPEPAHQDQCFLRSPSPLRAPIIAHANRTSGHGWGGAGRPGGRSSFRRSNSGSLAVLAAMRRASSRVSRLVAERCDAAICPEWAEVRDLRLKRR